MEKYKNGQSLDVVSTANLENALKDIVGNEKNFKKNFDKFLGQI